MACRPAHPRLRGSGTDCMRFQESMSERYPVLEKHRTRMAALDLIPRRQIRQPLRGGVNEHRLHTLVETSKDENTDKNEKQRGQGSPSPGTTTARSCCHFFLFNTTRTHSSAPLSRDTHPQDLMRADANPRVRRLDRKASVPPLFLYTLVLLHE